MNFGKMAIYSGFVNWKRWFTVDFYWNYRRCNIYPLVNVYRKLLGKIHHAIFMDSRTVEWAIFNSYVTNYQRVSFFETGPYQRYCTYSQLIIMGMYIWMYRHMLRVSTINNMIFELMSIPIPGPPMLINNIVIS